MATVKLISGQVVENAQLTDIKSVGEEGSRSAIAHINGKTYDVYNSIIDGFNDIWHEQMSYETWKMTEGATGFVEGSVSRKDTHTMSQEQHTPTPEEEAIYAGLLTVQAVSAIVQAYTDGKIKDLETYNHLYEVAMKADTQVQKLVRLLEQKGPTL